MAVLVVLVFLALVAFAAKRRFFPQSQLWFLKHHSKKQEEEHGETSAQQVEIVVDKPQNSSKLAVFDKGRKPLLAAKPPRYEEPAKEGSVEGSIRTALNELRSRQYVKSICSKFEARKAIRHSDDDDEEACIRAANADGDEYVLSEQSQQLRRDEHIVKVAPLPRRASAPKPNNLNAFLRRCSSNLDRANFAHSSSSDASNTLEQLEPLVPAAAAATVAFTAVPNVATRAAIVDPPAAPGRRSGLFDIDLNLQPADEYSNQCDSPTAPINPTRSFGFANDSDDAAQSNEDEPASDFDVTTTSAASQKDVDAPEQEDCSASAAKVMRTTVDNSVARFQQFQQQVPANYAARTPRS